MSVIVDVVNAVNSLSHEIKHFFNVEIYYFFNKWFAYGLKYATLAFYKFKNFAFGFVATFLEDTLFSITYGADVQAAFDSLDSTTLSFLFFFRIPEAVNIILSSYFSRMIFRLIFS
jgi:hypothetical protein